MHRYLFVAVLAACMTVVLLAQEKAAKPEKLKEGEAYFLLRDGSRVKGQIAFAEVVLKTAYGELKIPVKDVIEIRFPVSGEKGGGQAPAEDEVQTVRFTAVGKLEVEKLEVKTAGGTLALSKGDVKKIFFRIMLPDELTNTIGMKLRLIPSGEFVMGSPEDEKDRVKGEIQHRVKITKPFYMQTTEVTQGQWKAVMGDVDSYFKGDDLPVDMVTWNGAQEFLKKLSAKEGITYRLPTEAEWEYACRAGSTTRFCFGDDESRLGDYAWYSANSEDKTHPVAQKKPNAWGLYDMHGNVYEWCSDWVERYDENPAKDPQGPATGEARVLRGGRAAAGARWCRSAYRNAGDPSFRSTCHGFRVVRSPE